MKILQVFHLISLGPGGGTADVVYKLSQALSKEGREVTLYTSNFGLGPELVRPLGDVIVELPD